MAIVLEVLFGLVLLCLIGLVVRKLRSLEIPKEPLDNLEEEEEG